MRNTLFAAMILAAALTASQARAGDAYAARLNGASEVPPVATSGSGSGAVSYDAKTRTMKWTITWSGLSGPATMAHFHGPAAPGANAGVSVPIDDVTSPSTGSAVLTDAQAADLKAGRLYINIHTAANPKGEIRGQVMHAH